MKNRLLAVVFWNLLLTIFIGIGVVSAADEKPFAEKRVVLQISDQDPYAQTLVLNVTGNLLKHYGPDKVDVEIVAFGPGLRLLFADNDNAGRIQSLTASGVRFSACSNTLENFTKQLGRKPELNPNAKLVPAGVVQIVELVSKGFILVKP